MMRRHLTTLVLLALLVGTAWAAKTRFEYVQVKRAGLRAEPAPFSDPTGTLEYGDYVRIDKESGAWLKVTEPKKNVQGWIHERSVNKKAPDMSAIGRDAKVTVDESEAAASFKPFTPEVEKNFKLNNKDADFTWVDKMEAIIIPATTMRAFLKAGGVTASEGGAK